MVKVLIGEDNRDLNDMIRRFLERENFTVFQAFDGEEILNTYEKVNPDIVILDVMLPKRDGWDILKEIREKNKDVYVIMLTAKSEEYDKVYGFELGADDYITKPFSLLELMARIKAILRRRENSSRFMISSTDGNLVLYVDKREAYLKEEKLDLTHKEFELLAFFMKNKDMVKSRDEILNKVWGYDFYGDTRTVDSHVSSLRGKLKEYGRWIKTVWGYWYKYSEDE